MRLCEMLPNPMYSGVLLFRGVMPVYWLATVIWRLFIIRQLSLCQFESVRCLQRGCRRIPYTTPLSKGFYVCNFCTIVAQEWCNSYASVAQLLHNSCTGRRSLTV